MTMRYWSAHVAEPFHVARIRCGYWTTTFDVHPLIADEPVFVMVTVPLKRSLHFWPSEYVAEQLEPLGGVVGSVVGGVVGSVVGVPPPLTVLSWLRTEV